jgi:murein DD-endopeptidase MepM/ murein hydrolase activator NlpD
MRALLVLTLAAAILPSTALGYGWPLKPFDRPHPIRGSFGDPRYHLGNERELSSFHFGVDIAARDRTRVYAVAAGYVHAYSARLTVTSRTGREYGYWHVKPVVRTGMHVRRHQLLGRIIPGWGHLHFTERYRGAYKDPLRKRALSPYRDALPPTVDVARLLRDDGTNVDPGHVVGALSVVAAISDAPAVPPQSPWEVARLAPAAVWWTLSGPSGAVASNLVVDFSLGILPNTLYPWIYAPGTYQNKPHRPGRYLFWITHSLDTSAFPDGRYTLQIDARDDRANVGTRTIELQFANGVHETARTAAVRHLTR